MNYRPEIDGLRALAILPVIFFHAGISIFSGGFIGVDIFFVISGYLITSIIFKEMSEERFAFSNFYERRARRILPALITVLFVTIFSSFFILTPIEMSDFSESVFATALGISNFYFMSQVNYFAGESELYPLLHTWSLGIEEQYYLLFPLLLLFLYRRNKNILVSIFLMILASFIFSEIIRNNNADRNFYITFSRFWELGVGSFVAIYLFKNEIKANSRLAFLGLILIFFGIFFFDHKTQFPSLYTWIPIIGVSLIIVFTDNNSFLTKVLSLTPIRSIGLISYSLYLWHQPVFAFSRVNSLEPLSDNQLLANIPVIFLLSYLSWRYIEIPFRKKGTIRSNLAYIFFVVSISIFISFGLLFKFYEKDYEKFWVDNLSNFPIRNYLLIRDNPTEFSNFGSKKFGNKTWHENAKCQFNAPDLNDDIEKKIISCAKEHGKGVLIIGDSHAIDLYGVVLSRFDDKFTVGITRGSCRNPRDESCQFGRVLKFVQDYPDAFRGIIFEVGGLDLFVNSGPIKPIKENRRIINSLKLSDRVQGLVPNEDYLKEALAYLERLSVETEVIWFGPRAEPHIGKKHVMQYGCKGDFRFRENQLETYKALDYRIAELLSDLNIKKLKYLSQIDIFKFNLKEDFMKCNELFWSDGDHFSEDGEIYFGKKLPDQFINFGE